MYKKDKKASIIILISSIGLIVLGLNQIFEFFEFSNQKISSTLTIIFSILNLIFIFKLIKPKEVK
ncbi:MAG: hypothetical protein COZ17_02840 [Flavobacteriaceae bacterium CG_4_10_14_3_um_filter_33_47]|nr:hypothetical protein [Flavobacteriales bacterium]PIY12708.1 MAG: hypothetical protein COZ17_02840 [Flavobacteriaceae bacterium CG_4_10_14_3_um_filter_33_47]